MAGKKIFFQRIRLKLIWRKKANVTSEKMLGIHFELHTSLKNAMVKYFSHKVHFYNLKIKTFFETKFIVGKYQFSKINLN